MIKINLISTAKKKIGSASGDSSLPSFDTSDLSPVRLAITAGIKILIIFSGAYALSYYESDIQVPERQRNLSQFQQELSQMQVKNNSVAEVVAQAKKYEDAEAKLLEQIQTIEELRGDSLREIRVLDQVQKDMPERLWLSRIELTDRNTLEFEGLSATEAEINQLLDILGKNQLIKEVILGGTKEKVLEGFNLKEFKISCVFNKYEINKGDKSKSSEDKAPSSQPKSPSDTSKAGAG